MSLMKSFGTLLIRAHFPLPAGDKLHMSECGLKMRSVVYK